MSGHGSPTSYHEGGRGSGTRQVGSGRLSSVQELEPSVAQTVRNLQVIRLKPTNYLGFFL